MVAPEDGASRRALLSGAGLALAGAGSLALAGCGGGGAKSGPAQTQTLPASVSSTDVAILGAALELERRTVAAYVAGIPLLDRDDARAARQYLSEELEHAGELISLIRSAGAKAPPRQQSYPIGHPRSGAGVLAVLAGLEALQIASYQRWIPRLSPAPMRAAVATIMCCDAQHLAMVRVARGLTPAPSPFVTGSV